MNAKPMLLASIAVSVAVGLSFASVSTNALAASSEASDLDAKLTAKVARQRIKQRSPRQGKDRGANSECGNVEIGNNNSDSSARSRVNPRNNTVIVTGPIINAANCR
jgi:hypothetical protein